MDAGGHGDPSGEASSGGPTMVTCYESNWAGVDRDDLRMERQALERIYLFHPTGEYQKKRRLQWRVPPALLCWSQPQSQLPPPQQQQPSPQQPHRLDGTDSDTGNGFHGSATEAAMELEVELEAAGEVAGDGSGRSMTMAGVLEGVPVHPVPPLRFDRADPAADKAAAAEAAAEGWNDSGRSLTTCEDFRHVASFVEMLEGWSLANQQDTLPD